MKCPGRPERLFQAVTGTLVLSGLGCMVVGYVIDHPLVVTVGWWLGVLGVVFASLPLVLFLVVLVIEKLRR